MRLQTVMRSWRPIVLIAFLCAVLAACSDDEDVDSSPPADNDEGAPDVEVWSVEPVTLKDTQRWSGRLQPLRTTEVRAPMPGTITSIEVEPGDDVSAGDIIARQQDPDKVSQLQALQQRRDRLEEEYERWQKLADAGAAGPSEVTDVELRFLEAEQQWAQLQATAAAYDVRAPLSGAITELHVHTDSHVSEGQPIVEIDSDEHIGVRLEIPAHDTKLIERHDDLSVRDDEGRRYDISATRYIDHDHRNFARAELILKDIDDSRRRQVDVIYSDERDSLLVPWTAVISEDDEHIVAVVTDDPARVQRRTVELGDAHSQGIEVLSGLDEGELVVRYEPRAHPEGNVVTPQETRR